MNYMEKYNEWISSPYFDEETKEELLKIKDDEKEIEDRFFKELEFGTGGLRGVIGAGTNRINKYNIRKATQGLANYILKNVENAKNRGVVIAYDSRHKSPEFAKEAALVLNANGIKAYLFESLRTTPELSFTVRELGCAGGIVITASHNPPEYNGYKVYGEDGGQLVPKFANMVIEEIRNINDFSEVKYIDEKEALDKGLLNIIGEEIDRKYIDKVKSLVIRKDVIENMKDFKIVYTPLHGTGAMPVKRVLNEIGFENVIVEPKQEIPDSNFSTVKYPNPEEHDAFKLAIKLAEKENADIIIGTDPDCDRVGAVVKNKNGEYVVLTGNQTGALLIDYILSSMESIPKNGVIVKTIVTSELGAVIAKSYGVEVINTLTGFKFIGEKIKEFEQNKDKKFIFGYEESYGYLAGTFVRDKDGVIASMLIAEMAAYYKSKGMTLLDGLKNIYEKYGYYKEDLKSITLKGKEGIEKIGRIMNDFRNNPPLNIEGIRVKIIRDYKESLSKNILDKTENKLDLPKSNVLHFTLEDGSWFAIRPSGTEPKIKIYFSVVSDSEKNAEDKLNIIRKFVLDKINEIE
ncbi:alpha-phosphoglucomutase [Caminicella sporogenes DSM 14501]|uniref:Phosphoglucomutase n=1 Tax=Caminicella sporogenes DSM 14501 TaxID=1121266 RepID=A0A1M6SWD8_9FIRM|nr:phospho-sugar mutase [Caminicella sporogenes]RKD21921.1 phosphoglucomutase [Caminicella sporogenes]SHK48993.1 alpha-phosphoglucomutase [Caminicella sporogenes DSM 14501]